MPDRSPITPLSLPPGVRTILVFGGSFDPPHDYHLRTPHELRRALCGDSGWVLYIPAARSPHKSTGPRASDAHRIAMINAGLAGLPAWSIWTDEIDRAARARRRGRRTPSYMIDTLRRLRTLIPRGVKLRLIIGADQAAAFHRWKEPRRLIRLAEPLVMPRDPVLTGRQLGAALDPSFWTPAERRAWRARLAPCAPIDQSSTAVRDAIPRAPADPRAWRRRAGLRAIPRPVAQHILDHGLYGAPRPGRLRSTAS